MLAAVRAAARAAGAAAVAAAASSSAPATGAAAPSARALATAAASAALPAAGVSLTPGRTLREDEVIPPKPIKRPRKRPPQFTPPGPLVSRHHPPLPSDGRRPPAPPAAPPAPTAPRVRSTSAIRRI